MLYQLSYARKIEVAPPGFRCSWPCHSSLGATESGCRRASVGGGHSPGRAGPDRTADLAIMSGLLCHLSYGATKNAGCRSTASCCGVSSPDRVVGLHLAVSRGLNQRCHRSVRGSGAGFSANQQPDYMAGAEGFEPPSSVLETDSLAAELTPLYSRLIVKEQQKTRH